MEPLLPEGSSQLALLDAIPSMAFIVDSAATILEANRAARLWLGDRGEARLGKPLGSTVHCIFPRDSRGECGATDFCPSCLVRRSIEAAAAGRPAPRRLAHMLVQANGQPEDCWFQVSASPVSLGGRDLVLVALEDATQLVELRAMLPLCPGCGTHREPSDPLAQAQVFLRKHPDFLLADELCAECQQQPPAVADAADAGRDPE